MTVARRVVLPSTFTDTTLPILRDDTMLNEGSLAFFEPGHPTNPWTGVPADGDVVPNLAYGALNALTAGTEAEHGGMIARTTPVSSTQGLIERTTKGGLHVITSPTVSVVDLGIGVFMREKLAQYILSNPSHDYALSLWGRMTRQPKSQGWSLAAITLDSASSDSVSKALLNISTDGNMYPNGGTKIGARRNPAGIWLSDFNVISMPAAWHANGAVNAVTGTPDVTAATIASSGRGKLFAAGRNSSAGMLSTIPYRASGTNQHGSWVLYRVLLEDLTVAGRTYAEFDEQDTAEFAKHVTTTGGRYHGDTYTAPSTIS